MCQGVISSDGDTVRVCLCAAGVFLENMCVCVDEGRILRSFNVMGLGVGEEDLT